jgi:phosphoribosylformylglycinamidine synthase
MKKNSNLKTIAPSIPNVKVKALIVRAAGTNCDLETVHALKLAGAESDVIHINQLLLGRARLHPYHMIVIPGGFSYGDDISAGKVLANELRLRLKDQLQRFIESKKLIIGVCNGFQVLVKAGLLPGFDGVDEKQSVTLALNDSARFQCEWISMDVRKCAATWLNNVPRKIELPIAHGEGKFMPMNSKVMQKLKSNGQIVFQYAGRNPNGSEDSIAGVCNPTGTVLGLMPHPERFVTHYQHPNWTARPKKSESDFGDGYWIWESAVHYAKRLGN